MRKILSARDQVEMLSPWRTASGFDPFKVTHRLRDEFHEWFGQQYQQDPTKYSEKQWGAGMSHWPVIEDFLKDKYPAAHRGLMTGREDASALLDYPEASGIMSRYDDETGSDIQPYSSADHEKLGYDPAEVAAGMVLLHNQNRDGLSNGYLDEDKDRLVDIFNKRQQMQRNYEQRTSRWHLAGDGSVDFDELTRPTTLYRGVAILGMPPEQRDRINDLKNYDNWDGNPATLGKHLKIGPQIIQHLHEHQGGLGRYWTTNPVVAEDFAGRSMTNRNLDMYPDAFPAILKMHWDGTGLDTTDKGQLAPSHNFKEDEERVLQKGHPVKVHGLWVRGGQGSVGWGDVINPDPDDYDFGHLHIPGHYHPGVI